MHMCERPWNDNFQFSYSYWFSWLVTILDQYPVFFLYLKNTIEWHTHPHPQKPLSTLKNMCKHIQNALLGMGDNVKNRVSVTQQFKRWKQYYFLVYIHSRTETKS